MINDLRNIVEVFFEGRPIEKSAFLDRHNLPANW